jgi:hypothetical protein
MHQSSIRLLLILMFLPGTARPLLAQQKANDRELVSKTFPTLKLVRIPAQGKTFTMGSPKGEPGVLYNETQHEVT